MNVLSEALALKGRKVERTIGEDVSELKLDFALDSTRNCISVTYVLDCANGIILAIEPFDVGRGHASRDAINPPANVISEI